MILLVAGQKGGTGKTTLAASLAAMRGNTGERVALVDADPQESLADWAALREQSHIDRAIPCLTLRGGEIHEKISRFATKYDLVVDAGGRDSPEMRSAMLVADLVLLPIQPAQFDSWTLPNMAELVGRAREINPALRALVVINMASPSTGEDADARDFVTGVDGLDLAESVVRARVAHRRAMSEGLCALELPRRDKKAVAELAALYAEVFGNGD